MTMSTDEVTNFNKRFDELAKDGQDRERKHDEAHKEMMRLIKDVSEQNKRQFQMLEPMYTIFTSVKGFNGISAALLKGIIIVGAAGGVVYGIIKWLRMT